MLKAICSGKVLAGSKTQWTDKAVILIDKDKIAAVGTNIEIKDNYEIIDASGLYILPGFIDAHTHIGLEEEIYKIEGDDVNEMSDPVTPQLQALDGINLADIAFRDALKGGVTRVLSMPGSANIIGGQAVFLKTLASSMSDMVYKNPWGLKAALGENPKRVYKAQNKAPFTRMANANILRENFYMAARTLANNDQTAKNDPGLEYKLQPLIQVLKKEMPLLLHAHRADDILTALRIKDEFGFDLIIQHGTDALKIADELVDRGVAVFIGPLITNRAKVEMKDAAIKNVALLAKRGVNLSIITDHPVVPIEHLRVTAALAVREGLDEKAALQAITINPARSLRADKEIGSIEPGKYADLVAFDGHPFDFKSRIKWVMVDGLWWRENHE